MRQSKAESIVKAGFIAVLTSCVLTLVLLVAGVIFLAFTSAPDGVRRTALFDSVYFESIQETGGGLSVNAGTGEPVAVLIIWALIAGAVFALQMFLRRRLEAKESAD